MWKELFQSLTGDCIFAPPVSLARLALAEAALEVQLQPDLQDLLMESNGVKGEYELDHVWDIDRIVADNLHFRKNPDFRRLYMPFDCLLFFADAGNGDQFAFAVLDGVIRRQDVFAWNHEDDSRGWVAPSLRTFLEWWFSGKIKL